MTFREQSSAIRRLQVGGLTLLLATAATTSVHVIAAELRVRIIDEEQTQTPARAWVDSNGQRLFQPTPIGSATPYARDRSFSCDGAFSMTLADGTARLHVEKGKEYVPVEMDIEIQGEAPIDVTVTMRRWINMPQRGWYSADLHVHLGQDQPRILTQLALADDVHLIPAFSYWLRGRGEQWHADWPSPGYENPIVIGPNHLITRNNIEIERIERDAVAGGTVGATFLFNLRAPVTATRYGEHFPTDATLCRVARGHSPNVVLDSDKPSWAETVIGAALGLLDTVQLCHNHYHRIATGPGGYGMIGAIDVGDANHAVGDGLFHRTNELYYRLLNCGFRLGVSGGSAIGVKPMAAGHSRVYARISGPLTADRMWAAIKQGRTFATTGPMLSLTANGKPLGSTLPLTSGEAAVHLESTVESLEPLEALQIIHNGHVVSSRDLREQPQEEPIEATLQTSLTCRRSGWVAARVLFRAPDGLLRQAHTSPIYLSLDGHPTAFAADARYMRRWIGRLVSIANQADDWFPDDEARGSVIADYREADARYAKVEASAKEIWGD